MTRKLDIEAALERSLRKQVDAPRLDGRFDAVVWARIEAAQKPLVATGQAAAVASGSARWLFIINAIGASVAVVLIAYFGAQVFGGLAQNGLSLPSINVAVPEVSAAVTSKLEIYAPPVITTLALGVGLMFTSLGRRLRSEIQQFL